MMGAGQQVPAGLARTVREVWGAGGEAWLTAFPSLMARCAEEWEITIGLPFPDLTYNFVAPALRADGAHVVLKLGVPDRELVSGAAALQAFDGGGAARLLAADLERGALLLERVEPGAPLSDVPDEAWANGVAADVLRRLWRPAPADATLIRVEEWAGGFARLRRRYDGGSGPLPARLVDRAERVYADLSASTGERMLLHGDLHHGNILASRRDAWLAIDPKGLIGERAYDAAWLLLDRPDALLADPDPVRRMARRLDLLAAALDLDRTRLWGWGLARAVLSAVWSLEDHGAGWEGAIACAEILARVEG